MAKGFQLGDEVTITATIMKVLPGGVSSVNIPSYNYPFAIDTPQKAKPGDKVEITGFVTRIDVEEGKSLCGRMAAESSRSTGRLSPLITCR